MKSYHDPNELEPHHDQITINKTSNTLKNIRDESKNWVRVEQYMVNHSDDVKFSHGYCPKCYESAGQELK